MSDEQFLNKYTRSSKIVLRYYRRLMSQIADEVLEHESDFSDLVPCSSISPAEDLVERYSRLAQQAHALYSYLRDSGTPPSGSAVDSAFIDTSDAKPDEALNAWLADNPGIVVISIAATDCGVLIVYADGSSCQVGR